MYRSQKPTDKIGTKSKPLANKIQSKKSTIGKGVTNNNNLTYPLHKKPINRAQKPKILKSISNDTLFAGSDTDEKKPSLGFIDFLNKQATIIQRWYRRKKLRLAQLKVELLIEEVPPKNLHLEINQSNSIPEDLVIKRRRERAEKAKMDLIQELKMESSVVQDTSSELKTTHSPKQENNFIVDRLNELNSKHAEKRHLNIPNDGSSQIPRTSQKELLDSLTKVENKSVEIESDPLENNGDIKFSQEIDVQLDLEIGKAEEVNDILTAVNSYYSKYNKEDPLSRSEVEREPIYEDDFDVYDPGESLTMPEFKSVAYENYTISNNQVIQEPLDNHQLQSSNSSVDENPKDNVPQNGKNMEETSAIMNIPTTSTKKDSPKLTADRPIIRGVTPTMDQTQTRTNKIMDHRQASPVQISSNIFQPISSSPQFSYHKSVDNSKPPKMYTSSIDPQDKQANDRVNRIMDLLKSVDEPDISRNQPIAKDNLKEASETHSTAIVFEGVKAKMMSQQMEIETKTKMIDSLKNELIKYKEMNKEELNQHQKNLKSQLNLQRKEYETIVKRHLSFIDKVLNEKEEISKKSSELTSQVKNLEKMYQDKVKS
ncbi:hypothetical protein BC833DRAFT_446443 [Globomyces pollinis-pini]|nr:hypothetical protein BC833DRAFT_446443 [Globomyces pollinis-pini]